MTYNDILMMVGKACQNSFSNGMTDISKNTIVENATKIYIKQMELDFAREKLEKENK